MAIALNILNRSNYKGEAVPNCSYFGIYTGYNGSDCADFLRSNLHKLVIKELAVSNPPPDALRNAIIQAEINYRQTSKSQCTSNIIALLVVEDNCYIVSIGDCQSVISMYCII